MGLTKYTIKADQKPTEEQIEMIKAARKMQDELLAAGREDEVFDEECPQLDDAALLQAVEARYKRISETKVRNTLQHF